jgi:large subunit ribosomal protein L4
MTKVSVFNQIGEKTSETELNPKIFGLEKIDANLVHFLVRAQQNNARKSTAHTKNRGEVAGSGKKPWKQKGTGRARAGSIRSPLWRKGGITFGPRSNRNYSVKVNSSAFRKGLFTILTDKVKGNKLVVVENWQPTAKTKEFSKTVTELGNKLSLGKKFLIILPQFNKELGQAAQNLTNIKVLPANQLNAVDLLKHDVIVLKDAMPVIEKTYLKS